MTLALLALAGCTRSDATSGSSSGDTPSAKKPLRIAVIPKGTTHVFWKSVHAGAVRAAKELGNVKIEWKGPLLENDREGQINVVGNFVAQGVDGIVLAPLDRTALIPSVASAQAAGIPTVIFDSALGRRIDHRQLRRHR